jgi:hypothetical protein
MTIDEAIKKWQSKKRRMGCVSGTNWFCQRVKEFYPERLNRYTKNGDLFQHVVATNGIIRIDLTPYADSPAT